jgi:hypothetical protein
VRRSLVPKNHTPRLACVKPAASVHPEPGSNSSSYIVCLNKSKLIIMRRFSIGSFQISRFHYSYSFALTSLLKRLSIQYVYERVFLFVSLVSQSGCKSKKLISNWQMFFEVFFRKFLFLFFLNLTNLSMNFPCFAGCKCNIRFQISQAFWNLFLKIFFSINSVCLSVFQ